MCCSANTATGWASTSAASSGVSQTHTPRPSYPPLMALSTTGQPDSAANAVTSARLETGA